MWSQYGKIGVCLEELVEWNALEDSNELQLFLILFMGFYWSNLILFAYAQKLLNVFPVHFEFPQFHARESFELIFEGYHEKGTFVGVLDNKFVVLNWWTSFRHIT